MTETCWQQIILLAVPDTSAAQTAALLADFTDEALDDNHLRLGYTYPRSDGEWCALVGHGGIPLTHLGDLAAIADGGDPTVRGIAGRLADLGVGFWAWEDPTSDTDGELGGGIIHLPHLTDAGYPTFAFRCADNGKPLLTPDEAYQAVTGPHPFAVSVGHLHHSTAVDLRNDHRLAGRKIPVPDRV